MQSNFSLKMWPHTQTLIMSTWCSKMAYIKSPLNGNYFYKTSIWEAINWNHREYNCLLFIAQLVQCVVNNFSIQNFAGCNFASHFQIIAGNFISYNHFSYLGRHHFGHSIIDHLKAMIIQCSHNIHTWIDKQIQWNEGTNQKTYRRWLIFANVFPHFQFFYSHR